MDISEMIAILWKKRNKATSAIEIEKQPVKIAKGDVVEDMQSEKEFLMISGMDSKPCEEWVLDLTYTFLMCPNRVLLIIYEGVLRGAVIIRNNAPCKIVEIGTVIIKMFDGIIRTFIEVGHIPEPKQNLISLTTFDSKGHKYTNEDGVLKVSRSALVVLKRQKNSTQLYIW